MPTEIYLVKAGMTMTEGIVEEWYVPDGGRVNAGDLLYRLETEKINLDVDAEASGVVKHLVAVGVTKAPGDVIGYLYADGDAAPADPEPPRLNASEPPRSSPAARRLAHELGVDMASLTGTGPGGRIVETDVQKAHAAASVASVPVRAAAGPASSGETIPLKGMRRTIAQRMLESLRSSAQLTMDMTVAMDDAARLREQLIAEWKAEGIRPTYTDLVLRAVARALRAFPRMNSALHDAEIRVLPEVHLGLAVALDDGLVVPVIRHTDRLDFKSLVKESARLAELARTGSLGVDDVSGGTFTVSALGMFGVDSFTPILNAPQTGILGVNRVYDGVAWEGQQPVRCRMMGLSLTWDHRVLDGAPAARFLGAVKELLEAPYRLLV